MIYQHIFNDNRPNYESFFFAFKGVVNYSEKKVVYDLRKSLEFIRALAINCNKFGLPEKNSVKAAVRHYVTQDFTIAEIKTCFSKVYKEYSADHASDVNTLIQIINNKN